MNIRFQEKIEVSADPEKVWKIVSKWEDIPNYWHGTTKILNLGNGLFKIRFAFPANGVMKFILLERERIVVEEYIKGPLRGIVRIGTCKENDSTLLSCDFDVKLIFPYSIFGKWSFNHFREGATHALVRIKERSES
ncbi:hypothetical protein [Thermoplasma volcanium GSS1]|uniref:Coenzyme Q-binding protein COQ10 START domain-containing protein n=1 Tax=Thermoplasma volcanium (strain ATCC 51530 / DSM 4299 / JCM 9571 / NBRC 15438 / GSS1) TaxID=273116 RepID=Q979A7_THEVO|nr:SRPBCC family protein [Thermoplasma volcanium]BAB60397.1 hypothetical protein [Thermoplasma volcanium GSS1]